FRGDAELEHVLVVRRKRVHPRVLQNPRLERNVQEIAVHRIRLFGRRLHRNPFLLAIGNHLRGPETGRETAPPATVRSPATPAPAPPPSTRTAPGRCPCRSPRGPAHRPFPSGQPQSFPWRSMAARCWCQESIGSHRPPPPGSSGK